MNGRNCPNPMRCQERMAVFNQLCPVELMPGELACLQTGLKFPCQYDDQIEGSAFHDPAPAKFTVYTWACEWQRRKRCRQNSRGARQRRASCRGRLVPTGCRQRQERPARIGRRARCRATVSSSSPPSGQACWSGDRAEAFCAAAWCRATNCAGVPASPAAPG